MSGDEAIADAFLRARRVPRTEVSRHRGQLPRFTAGSSCFPRAPPAGSTWTRMDAPSSGHHNAV